MPLQIPFSDVPIISAECNSVPLAVVHVHPLIHNSLSAPLVKRHLLSQSKTIDIQWDRNWRNKNFGKDSNRNKSHDNIIQYNVDYRTEIIHGILYLNDNRRHQNNHNQFCGRTVPIVVFPSQDPTATEGIPCIVRAFSARHLNTFDELITLEPMLKHDTLFHICPNLEVNSINIQTCSCEVDDPNYIYDRYIRPSFKQDVLGESNVSECYKDKRLLLHFERDIVEALTLRMQILLDREIVIGTTINSIQHWIEAKERRRRFKTCSSQNKEDSPMTTVHEDTNVVNVTDTKSFLDSAILIVHDPVAGSGKTTLVATIAKCKLHCDMVHVINAPFLFAQYGANGADAALEALLHQLVLSAAVQSKKICIILDHLETFLPPSISGGKNNGDPALPALNSIATYLSKLNHSLQTKGAFPFSTRGPFYNSSTGTGHVYSTQLCLVAVITRDYSGGDDFGSLGNNMYRLPALTIQGRFSIMMQLLDDRGVTLDKTAKENLPLLLASTQLNKRGEFNRIILKLQSIRSKVDVDVVTLTDLKKVFNTTSHIIELSDSQSENVAPVSKDVDMFSSIGGNTQAKKALLDALAFDDRKRLALARFGMSPPNGCILYGPPGNGKTLLAKATARMMRDKSSNLIHDGGLFISLSASEIVRSEVGKSEKLIASAFDMARKSAPSVIFIDEFQALFTSRDDEDGQSKGSGRLSSVLLQCMDDISKWKNADRLVEASESRYAHKRVVVLAATNTPWMVDKAFLRAGRFDRVVHVSLPDQSEREEILRLLIGRMRLDDDTSIDEVCQILAKTTINFSGADLAALVRAAAVRSLHEQSIKEDMEVKVNIRHFLESKKYDLAESSCDQQLVERLNRWKP